MPNYTQTEIEHAKQWHMKAFDEADEQIVKDYHQAALKNIIKLIGEEE